MLNTKLIYLLLLSMFYTFSANAVIVVLPFYGDNTGFGLGSRAIFRDFGPSMDFDLTAYGSTSGTYGSYLNFGQKKIPFLPIFFWNVYFDTSKNKNFYYGVGNNLDDRQESKYEANLTEIVPSFGINIGESFKLSVEYIRHFDKVSEIKYTTEIEESDTTYGGIGYKLEMFDYDSRVRPKKGTKIIYNYKKMNDGDYRYARHTARVSQLIPISKSFSHGISLFYDQATDDIPFYSNPKVKVRGVQYSRHNGLTSAAIINELRIYATNDLMFTPFYDVGRVYKGKPQQLEGLHQSFGLGLRYIIEDALVLRMDIGVTAHGESNFDFRYGHTF